MAEQLHGLLPRYERAGVRLVLAGHEHNFQHSRNRSLNQVVAGAGAKLDTRRPTRWTEAHTQAWAAEPHCVLVEAQPDRLIVTPYGPGADGQPFALQAEQSDGEIRSARLIITPDD
jgi:hypothetical protein